MPFVLGMLSVCGHNACVGAAPFLLSAHSAFQRCSLSHLYSDVPLLPEALRCAAESSKKFKTHVRPTVGLMLVVAASCLPTPTIACQPVTPLQTIGGLSMKTKRIIVISLAV